MAGKLPPVLFLMGPTATGKTDLACRLMDTFPCELVSVDAAQVYQGMDIGTAKPNADFLSKYPHHLINIRRPDDFYSVAEFCQSVKTLIVEITQRQKLPILVGGTMFYFFALEKGLSDLPASDSVVRQSIQEQIEQQGVEAMHDRLFLIDSEMANKITKGDRQRLQRALEIAEISKQQPSSLMRLPSANALPNPIIKISLFASNRSVLHQRIEQRFHQMIEQGLVNEVENLVAQYHDIDVLPTMRTVGYRQCLAYLRGELTATEWVDKGVAATRQLAKRQLTWLRNQNNLVWVDVLQADCGMLVSQYLQDFG